MLTRGNITLKSDNRPICKGSGLHLEQSMPTNLSKGPGVAWEREGLLSWPSPSPFPCGKREEQWPFPLPFPSVYHLCPLPGPFRGRHRHGCQSHLGPTAEIVGHRPAAALAAGVGSVGQRQPFSSAAGLSSQRTSYSTENHTQPTCSLSPLEVGQREKKRHHAFQVASYHKMHTF